MIARSFVACSLFGSILLAACGQPQPATSSSTATASTDTTSGSDASSTPRRRRRRSSGSSAASTTHEDTGSTTSEASDAGDDELPLDPPTVVPGTGVTLRPPLGSRPLPVGAGFVHARRRIQMVVATARGDEAVVHGVEASLGADADELSHEDVTIGGRPTRLVVDTQMAGDIELERVWIFTRSTAAEGGDRALAIVAAYQSDRSERLRPLVRAALLSTVWDTSTPIEPERAVGYHLVTPPEGLVAEPQVVSTLTYAVPGSTPTPASGNPALLVVPIPMQIPAAQRVSACEQILVQAGPVSADTITSRATITMEDATGCEVFGTQTLEHPAEGGPSEIATYAALIFVGDASFMVAGFVDARERETWAPRFSAAARTVAPVPR
jgi:hypothetical protein